MIKIVSLGLSSVLLSLLLGGCTIHQSIGDSFGSYVSEPDGQPFKAVGYRWDYENTALIYVYRPATQWSMDELETPSFNVNDERLFNIKGGGYTWYEMEPGEYDVIIRRGLLGLEGIGDFVIKRVAQLRLDVKPGKVYYLRYSEIDPPTVEPDLEDIPLGDGPLQLVAPSIALAELPVTKMIHHGRDRLKPRPVAEDEMAEQVFGGSADADSEEVSDESGAKAKPRTKAEEWWPF